MSDLTKGLILIGFVWIYFIAVGAFWWGVTTMAARHLGLPAVTAASAIYCVVLLTLGYAFNRAWLGATGRIRTPAIARRDRRIMTSAALYAIVMLTIILVRGDLGQQGVLAYALAVVAAIPVVGMAWALGLYIRDETDEFERAVSIENALWATGATLSIATVWGFAEVLAAAPHVGGYIWFPVWALSAAVADIFTRRRYR